MNSGGKKTPPVRAIAHMTIASIPIVSVPLSKCPVKRVTSGIDSVALFGRLSLIKARFGVSNTFFSATQKLFKVTQTIASGFIHGFAHCLISFSLH
jgi:hypothetical protein